MKKNNASMLGLLAMEAALGSMDGSGGYGGSSREDARDRQLSLDEWAKKKRIELEARSRDRRSNYKGNKKGKTKKHRFNVTYGKGVKPVFKKA